MQQKDILQDLNQIRTLMEKSNKVISISGLSGILIGIYTLLAIAFLAIKLDFNLVPLGAADESVIAEITSESVSLYILTAGFLLLVSVLTVVGLAWRKSALNQQVFWNSASKALLTAMSVPLVTGAIFAILAASKGMFEVTIASFLVFYGLSLFSGGNYTFKEIKLLGTFQIILGLMTLLYSSFSLLFFGIGFGVLHIVFGTLILKRY